MVMNKTYDVCFGIGEACMCSQSLRKAGLQFASYPFDWVGSHNPLKCAQILAADFKDYLNREDFVYKGTNPKNGLGIYRNLRTDFGHPHDFVDRPVIDEEMYRDLTNKYGRRISRLQDHLTRAKRVLMVCVCLPKTPTRDIEEMKAIQATVLGKYPHLNLDFLIFQHEAKRTFEEMKINQVEEGIVEVRFNYHNDNTTIDISKIAAALKQLGVRAVDYRSAKEIAAFRKLERAKKNKDKYRKYCATSYLSYAYRRHIVYPITKAICCLKRKRYEHVLSLGMNCEVAFRQTLVWGAVDASLFNWGVTGSIQELTDKLYRFDAIFNGEIELRDAIWRCSLTGLTSHGRVKIAPQLPQPSDEVLAADKEDLRGRMKHMKEKFLRQISSDDQTLFVRRLSDADLASPSLKEDLLALDQALVKLGAKNHEYLLIVERVNRQKVPTLPHAHVRTVECFNPVCDVANKNIGDFVGWSSIFNEFVQKKKPTRKHQYKFEQ